MRAPVNTTNSSGTSAAKVCGYAVIVIVPLIAAAWLPPGFPHLLRQAVLFAWGVGAILVTERILFSDTLDAAVRALGFVRPNVSMLVIASLASVPMWAFLPFLAWTKGTTTDVRPDWLYLLLGVVLVNGITEEAVHRGFVFGHLRRGRSFAAAATVAAVLFAAQHLYIIVTSGPMIGVASVVLAALLAYPLAWAFERGGHSIAAPAVLHTSSNAPAIIIGLPEEFMATALVTHMGVVLLSMYLVFAAPNNTGRGLDGRRP